MAEIDRQGWRGPARAQRSIAASVVRLGGGAVLLACSAVLLTALSGCTGLAGGSSEKAQPLAAAAATPEAGKARVYLVLGQRHNGPLAQPLNNAVWMINGYDVGRTVAGQTLVADLPPGNYRFAWQASWLPRPEKGVKGIAQDQVKLVLEAGEPMIVFANLEQIAGLTSDDYRTWVEVGSRDEALRAPAGTMLAANVQAVPPAPLDGAGELAAPPAAFRSAVTTGRPAAGGQGIAAGSAVPGASPSGVSPSGASPSGASPSDASPSGASPSGASPSGASPSSAASPSVRCNGRPIAERLRELESLARQGLVTPEEYSDKRRTILDCL